MACSVLISCGQKLTPILTRQFLPSFGAANLLTAKKPHLSKNAVLILNPSLRRQWSLEIQHTKFCSSSIQENSTSMKERMTGYFDAKGRNLNFSHVAVISKDWFDAIRADFTELKSCPMPPLVIGFGAVTPFVAVPVHFIMSAAFVPSIAHGQLAYGAIFISFLGGIRWGASLEDPKWNNLIKSMTPYLVGWTALLLPYWLGCFSLSAGLISLISSDRQHTRYQPWFRSYCVAMSSVALLSIVSSLFLNLALPSTKN